MTELHKLAFEYRNSDTIYAHKAWQELEQYVKQLINEERESCAKVCDELVLDQYSARYCASAIRARI